LSSLEKRVVDKENGKIFDNAIRCPGFRSKR